MLSDLPEFRIVMAIVGLCIIVNIYMAITVEYFRRYSMPFLIVFGVLFHVFATIWFVANLISNKMSKK